MQVKFHFQNILFLIATLIGGVFLLNAPHHASANGFMGDTFVEDAMPMSEKASCQTNSSINSTACQKHCFTQSSDGALVFSTTPSQTDHVPACHSLKQTEHPFRHIGLPFIRQHCTPPAHTFLRSVIKLE